MKPKDYIVLKIKKEGKGNQYEQAVRVTKTFANECGNAVVGNTRRDLLLTQIANLQASIEVLKVINNITSDELIPIVNNILGIPNIVEEEIEEETTIPNIPSRPTKPNSPKK